MEPWLTRAARIHPERTALTTGSGDATMYVQLHDQATAVAGALRDRGRRRW